MLRNLVCTSIFRGAEVPGPNVTDVKTFVSNGNHTLTEIDATQSPVEPVNRRVQYGCKKYNFCIIVPRGTLKSGTRNLKLFDRRRYGGRCTV